jgi:hypothetical protein
LPLHVLPKAGRVTTRLEYIPSRFVNSRHVSHASLVQPVNLQELFENREVHRAGPLLSWRPMRRTEEEA